MWVVLDASVRELYLFIFGIQDLRNMDVKRVCIMTDKVVGKLPAVTTVLDAVIRHNINYDVFDGVRTEPTENR